MPSPAVRSLIERVKARDLDGAKALLQRRPQLARMSSDNFGVLHHAVLNRDAAMVRLLMANGANARDGVYPYREQTTAHALALMRGDSEIVRIIEDAERTRPHGRTGYGADPTPLHRAANAYDTDEVTRLLASGADVDAKFDERTALDIAAERWWQADTPAFERVARVLLAGGASLTPKAAAALGDVAWLREQHAEGKLDPRRLAPSNLLRISVTHSRPEVLEFLLDVGFDPDERQQLNEDDDVSFNWGMPLQHAAQLDRYEMAETLLKRGADSNAEIYASGTPLSAAHGVGDKKMVALLERYGATLSLPFVVESGTREQIEEALAANPKEMIASALVKGDADVLRRALPANDWTPDDPRWFNLLEECPRHGTPGHLECLRVLLERVDPNLRGRSTDNQQFGLTTLHNIVARGNMAPEARVAMANVMLDAGARLDIHDNLLQGTPLDWARRWGQTQLVDLFLSRLTKTDPPDV